MGRCGMLVPMNNHVFFTVRAQWVSFIRGDHQGSIPHDGSLQNVQDVIEYVMGLYPGATLETRIDAK